MSRPGGMGGGGMSRPGGMSGGMSRPGGGGMPGGIGGGGASRPSMPTNRPSLGNVGSGSRPNVGNVSRPNTGNASRPSLGGIGGPGGMDRPGQGNISRPGGAGGFDRPGIANANRPSLGNIGQPGGLPGIGGGGRPGAGGGGIQLPGIGDRPGAGGGGIQLPGGGNRPGGGGGISPPRPGGGGIAGGGIGGGGDRPGGGGIGPSRPGSGGGGIAGGGNRPIDPGFNRPGEGVRPGGGGSGEQWRPGDNRPGGGGRPDRPIIGGGGNYRPGNGNINIGGGNTVIGGGNNIGNRWGINNRPGGDWWSQNHNWNNWNNGAWHNNWHNNYINNNYGWYNGAWNNNWGSGWYAPLAAGAVGWGLGSWYNNYAYGGGGYYNPYYTSSVAMPYDYSQPVVLANYATSDYVDPSIIAQTSAPQIAAAQPPPLAQNDAAQQQFDQGLAQFKAGDYQDALTQFDATLRQLPNDPVVHEVRALDLFALGQYQQAAASLNSLLASAPGMDWTTMAGLYGDVDDYTKQLRALEQHCKANPKDAPASFVLAYQYLVTGHQEPAVHALQAVVREQPKDVVAKRMLASLVPPGATDAATAASLPPPPPTTTAAAADQPQTDLVGTWQAKAGDSSIDLKIGDDSRFSWKATQPGKPAVELSGGLTASSDSLVLESKDQGSMIGRVKSVGPDKWQFAMAGGPPNDPGLSFERVK
jgi:tetratricopeptide (TPR) repeat protein